MERGLPYKIDGVCSSDFFFFFFFWGGGGGAIIVKGTKSLFWAGPQVTFIPKRYQIKTLSDMFRICIGY